MEKRNPYAAPVAPVADISLDALQYRPWQLVVAVRLICGALVVALIHAPFVLNRRPGTLAGMPGTAIVIVVAVLIVFLLIVGLFIWAIYRGRNWARITYSVLAVAGSLPFAEKYWERLVRSPVDGGIELVQVLLELTATVLLWSGPTGRWFKSRWTPAPERTAITHQGITER